MIGKIEKARRYAEEPDRVRFTDLTVSFRGEHDDYSVSLHGDKWQCNCNFFHGWGTCCHTMAMQRILGKMLSHEALESALTTAAS